MPDVTDPPRRHRVDVEAMFDCMLTGAPMPDEPTLDFARRVYDARSASHEAGRKAVCVTSHNYGPGSLVAPDDLIPVTDLDKDGLGQCEVSRAELDAVRAELAAKGRDLVVIDRPSEGTIATMLLPYCD